MHPSNPSSDQATNDVEIVLTDEVEIYERRTVPPELLVETLKQLNGDVSRYSRRLKWREPLTYREPLKAICRTCGAVRPCSCSRSPSLYS